MSSYKDITITDDGGVLRASGNGDFVDLYGAMFAYLGTRRGWDTWTVTLTKADGTKVASQRRCPKSTFLDVVQIDLFWSTQLATGKRTRTELDGRRAQWIAAASEVTRLSAGARPTDLYPKNREFWAAAKLAAIACDVEREVGDDAPKIDAVVGFFQNDVPDAIGGALSWAGRKIKEGAEEAGSAAGAAARAAFGLDTKELLIGGGLVVGALVLLPRVMGGRS